MGTTSHVRTTPEEMLAGAMLLARHGASVLRLHYPLPDGSCSCGDPDHHRDRPKTSCGKHPSLGKGWQEQATSDPQVIARWWSQEPLSNVGFLLNPEVRKAALDIDTAEGEALLAELSDGNVPPTWEFVTGGGGRRLVFRVPDGCSPKVVKMVGKGGGEALRFMCGKNAQTAAPPSWHHSERPYRWVPGRDPDSVPLADMPGWMLEVMCPPPAPSRNGSAFTAAAGSNGWTAERRAIAYLGRCPPAVSGQGGHDHTFGVARAVVYGFDLGPEVGFNLLWEHWNPACLPPWSERELKHKCQEADTKPFDKPRGWLRDQSNPQHESVSYGTGERRGTGSDTGPPPPDPPAGGDAGPSDDAGAVDPHTDLANGRRFAAEHRDHARYSHPESCWYTWTGCRWKKDDTGAAVRMAKDTVGRMLRAAATQLVKAGDDPVKAAAATRAIKWATGSQQAGRLEAMIRMAQSEPGVSVLPEQFDADPWALNCANGTIDLRTGTLRPHRRDDLITALCPHEYDPEAPCPPWDEFLLSVFDGSTDMVVFVRRLFGYMITGDTSIAILPVFWGEGSNGKSTLVETVFRVVGPDYTAKAAPDLLLASKGDRHPTELADLKGKRLVVAMETEEGRRLNEPLIKELTGGDRIKARRMREDFWEFDPTHKLCLGTNHKPAVKTGGHGMWRRLRLIPFTQKFWRADKGETGPEHLKADLTLKEKLAAVSAGILAWLVRGCIEWQQHGRDLATPEQVNKATSEYQAEEDIFARFFDDRLTPDPAAKISAADLYKAYLVWCEEEHEKPLGKKAVGGRMRGKGYEAKKSNGNNVYIGLRLRQQGEGASEQEAGKTGDKVKAEFNPENSPHAPRNSDDEAKERPEVGHAGDHRGDWGSVSAENGDYPTRARAQQVYRENAPDAPQHSPTLPDDEPVVFENNPDAGLPTDRSGGWL